MVGESSLHKGPGKPASSVPDAHRLIDEIEKSQVPFGESAPMYARIKALVDAGRKLSADDFANLQGLARKAKDWEEAVESSAGTRPEETMGG